MSHRGDHLLYVLITAARNEEAFIEKTIQSVVSQTVLPVKWVIVDDGSTDATKKMVQQYAAAYDWIELVEMPAHRDRNFAAKVYCFNAGYEKVRGINYQIIGNLDADVSFDEDYFAFLLEKFSEMPTLGVAGTRYLEGDRKPTYSFRDVAGQCQIFRRECFEEIGRYFPSRYGGVDWIAVRTARMKGWETITFDEKTFSHNRLMGTAESNVWLSKIHYGKKDYFLGNHPLWEFFRIAYQMTRKPYFIGGALLFFGYASAYLNRMERPISQELINFHRKEQMGRLKSILSSLLAFRIRILET